MEQHDLLNRISHLNEYLKQDPVNTTLLLELSSLYFLSGDLASAQLHMDTLDTLDQAQFNEEQQINYNLLKARILQNRGDYEEGVHCLNTVLSLNPNEPQALGLLSLMHCDLNDLDLAQELSSRALKLDPDNYEAAIVDILIRLESATTSSAEIKSLLKINPNETRLLYALGCTHMAEGSFKLAQQNFKKVIDLDPNFYDSYILSAWTLVLENKLELAEQLYEQATLVDDTCSEAFGGLAITKALAGNLSSAEELVAKSYELNPECFLTQMAEIIYSNYKNPKQAHKLLLKSLDKF